MTDATASLPPKFLPAKPAPSGTPGLEDDSASIAEDGQFWSTEEGPTFAEFLDIINPLQHIPLVSSIYRAITGDEIGAGPRFVGGMLFGGPIGALAAGVTALFEEASGGDLGAHLAEMVDDLTGGGEDAPAIAANPAAAAQQAALPATAANTEPAAQHLNRISLNPAAALGAAQAMPLGAVQNPNQNTGNSVAEAAQQNAVRRRTARLPARLPAQMPATHLPDGAKIFPAHPAATGISPAMQVPFGGNRPGSRAGAAPASAPVGAPVAHQAAPQLSNAVARSRRQQTDLMLAQWAAQQMAQQNATSNSSGATERKAKSAAKDDTAAAQNATPHPMLPPRNASPEWYAQAMDKALNQYRAGAKALPAGVPALSVTR